METIAHKGIVEEIHGNHIQVRIVQASACSECESRQRCVAADQKEKLIDIIDASGKYRKGQVVCIIGKTSVGLSAVLLAYVLPLLILVGTLPISLYGIFPGNEGLAALIALSCTGLYYLTLIPFRKSLLRKFSFTLRPSSDETSFINPS